METNQIIHLIARIRSKANALIINELEKNELGNLAPSHGDILAQLFRHEELTMKELAEKIDRDKSTVTPLITKLIHLGYVLKMADPKDKRISNISLTQKGMTLKPLFEEISKKLIDQTYSSTTPSEQQTLIRLLSKINDNW